MTVARAPGIFATPENLHLKDAAELLKSKSPELNVDIDTPCDGVRGAVVAPAAPRLKPRVTPTDAEMSELVLPASCVPAFLGVPTAPCLRQTEAPKDIELLGLLLPACSTPVVLGVPAAPRLNPRAAPAGIEMPELVLPDSSIDTCLKAGAGMEEDMRSPMAPLLLPCVISERLQSMPAFKLPEAALADLGDSCSPRSELLLASISTSDVDSNHSSEDYDLFCHVFSDASTSLEA